MAQYREQFRDHDFPGPDELEVVSRENTGAGRFVYLQGPATEETAEPDDASSVLLLPEDFTVEMEGVPLGLGFQLFVDNGGRAMLELFTYVGSWDGEERSWRLVSVVSAREQSHA